jgi:hypothetical protein
LARRSGAPVAVCFEVPFDGIANVRGHVLKVGKSIGIARHSIAVILDRQIMSAVFSAASDGDSLRLRVDAVLNELGNRFERIAL